MIALRPSVLAAAVVSAGLSGPAFATANLQDVLPGARAQGMGSAYTALADGPFGIPYNAAGMAGAPDLELALSLQRLLGPPAPLAGVFLGYARPLPEWPWGGKTPQGSSISAAFYAVRHQNVADKDTFLVTYARKVRVRGFANPISIGAGTRLVSFRSGTTSELGFGFDGGILAEGPLGLRLGASLSELMLVGTALREPTFSLGGAYLWKDWILGAVDVRIREGRRAIHPGVEFRTMGGLLKYRAGVDLRWAGVDQFSFGLGVDYSPILLDFAFSLPPAGLNKRVGSYQASINYRFGAAPFYGQFVGRTAEESARLRRELEDLRDQKTLLEQQVSQIEAAKTTLQSQVGALEGRLDDVRLRAKGLEEKAEEQKLEPPPIRPQAPPAPPKWPRAHVVVEGDTLRSLAGRYYGDPTRWEKIYKANPDKIERGLPRIGAELTIPEP